MRASNPQIDYRIKRKASKSEGVLNYDYDNLYAQWVRELVRSSGTASNCVKMYSKFISGGGFKDKTFYKSKVNSKGLRADKFQRKISEDYALFGGFAFLVKYDALLNPVEVYNIPFEFTRLADPEYKEHYGKIAVYEDWDRQKNKSIKKENIDWIYEYNPDKEILKEQIELSGGYENFKGQILWHSNDEGSYPLPIYDSVIEDIETNVGIKIFRLRNTKTCFLGAKHFELPYEFETDKERDEFKETLVTFQGVDNANRILMTENKNAESTPIKITDLESKDNDNMFKTTNQTSKDSIIESFSMPPILAGVQVAGKLGGQQDLQDAYEYYNIITSDERLVVEEYCYDVFSRFKVQLNPTGDYSVLPLSLSTVNQAV